MPDDIDRDAVLKLLNQILESELAGVVRYTHYSFMVFGFNRIPITKWLREQADESLSHAQEAGEMVTHFGGHPSLGIGKLLEGHKHDLADLLRESLAHEREGLELYKDLLGLVDGRSILLDEYARKMIAAEELHLGEVDKMLRGPGSLASVRDSEMKRKK
jgi:bacterioferritin